MNINLRGGWAMIKSSWLSWFQLRSFFFVLAFGWMIPPLIYHFVWATAASGKTIGGMDQGEFRAYYLLFILVNQLTYSQTNWTVGDGIRDGSISVALLRPVSPIFGVVAAEIAGKVVYMTFVTPIAVVLGLLLHPELHPTLLNVLTFIPTLVLAWLLRFFWGYWIALLAFWAGRANALLAVQSALIFLFAGQVAPVSLLPGLLQTWAEVLPFRYMIGCPVEILTGHLEPDELLRGCVYQLLWLIVSLLLFIVIWRQGLRRYSAIGG